MTDSNNSGDAVSSDSSSRRLEGRVAVITGSASGIGRATALLFARHGATIVGIDVNEAGNQSLLSELKALNAKPEMHTVSIGDAHAIAGVANDVLGRHSAIHVLFNNAATTHWGSIEETPEEALMELMTVNLGGAYRCIREFLPGLKRAGNAAIVNNASVDGLFGNPRCSAYSSTKAGMYPMTHTLAYELAPFGIRINAIATGGIRTAAAEHLPEAWLSQLAAVVPLKRWGRPEEVANVALFLASSEASYVTGSVITVDGGRTGLTPGTLEPMAAK